MRHRRPDANTEAKAQTRPQKATSGSFVTSCGFQYIETPVLLVSEAKDTQLRALRQRGFEVSVHEEAAVAAVKDLVQKVAAIHAAAGHPDPNAPPPAAKVVPLADPAEVPALTE